MIEIRSIRENDYQQVAEIWRKVLDIPVTDECLASGFQRYMAQTFYEHMGYRKTTYWFRKSL